MRRLLLVDDEETIRKGIRTIIERAGTGFSQVLECSNGQEALDIVASQAIDLVVLDIRMPEMDGVTFMQRTQGLKNRPKFIVVSGYSDFEYAQESLKHGAKAYLLKPLDNNELVDIIKRVEEEITQEEKISLKNQKAEMIFDKFREDQLNHVFSNANLPESRIRGIIEETEILLFHKNFRICLFKKRNGMDFSESEALLAKTLISHYGTAAGYEILGTQDEQGNIAVATEPALDVYGLATYLNEGVNFGFAAGVSDLCKGIEDIHKAYCQAAEALRYMIIYTRKSLFYYKEIVDLPKHSEIPLNSIKKIGEMIGTERYNEIERLLEEIFDIEVISAHRISYLEDIVINVNKHVVEKYDETHLIKDGPVVRKQMGFGDVYGFKNLQEYYTALKNYILEVNGLFLELKESRNNKDDIDRAIEYINSNFDKDINMVMVSNHISLTYTYFSYLFKERTGHSFSDYLKAVRIDKAKELLKNSSLMISDVAQKVGYKNPKHFRKTFREVTGISPVEYRDKPV